MYGLMMNVPLTISSVLDHAETFNRDAEIVSRKPEGGIHRYTYRDAAGRSRKLARALQKLGVNFQDRVATLAWNTHRHYELYYAVSGSGAIIHTINPRLFPDQIVYIINHAEDVVLFVDITFVPLIEKIFPKLTTVQHVVVMVGRAHMPDCALPLLCYEDLVEAENEDFAWPQLDENLAAAICYTSGTTGNPKGVLYSHRSTVLHAMSSCSADILSLSSRTSVLPVVPMFHVNAWGIPYSATMAGCKLVLPAGGLDGKSLYELVDAEKVDLMLGVPTVWLNLLQYCDREGLKLESVDRLVIGGSAVPRSMIKAFQEKHDAFVIQGWGMTEMSPVGSTNSPSRFTDRLPLEERYDLQVKAGRALYGVQMRIAGPDGAALPNDGKSVGRLLVRGPWIASAYYKEAEHSAWRDGWFDTGDVATIDEQGFLSIVDRAKDIIKSGGEWISSVDVENVAMGHPAIAECAVVGLPHPQWAERPLLVVVPREGASADKSEILHFLAQKIAKWWLPDDVIFVRELPHTATGKVLKRQLRQDFHDLYQTPEGLAGQTAAV
ncbi:MULTISPECIES: long-chain-fatty-acid--CoA ligase [Rhodomicrobium]|uniref:long-chain-fatty-acid--CoA ligase n=1 Tax=Rhodomicrobium TaxID=1068 RepID=UPI000B4A6550|nr:MULTISPECIES: long-chain-fatty-acid--CoA ligase [Rhodomicrobium]